MKKVCMLPLTAGIKLGTAKFLMLQGIKVIYKRLFRIYAHVFHTHFKAMSKQRCQDLCSNIFENKMQKAEVLSARQWWTVMQMLICA